MRSRILAIVGLTAGIFHQSSAQFVAENSATGPFSSDGSECHEICGRPHIAVVGYTIQDCRCDEIQSDTEVKFDLVKRQLTNTGPPGALLTSLFGGGKPSTESTETTATSTKDSLTTTQTSDAAQTSDANGDGTSSLSAGVAVTSTGTHSTAVTPHSTSASSSSDQSGNGAPLSDTSANAALSQSATIGIGVGVGVGVAILIGAIAAICIARRRRARARHEDIFNGKYEGHAPSESSMVEARDIPTSGLLPGAYMKQPLSQTTGYYESAGPYDAHQQPEPMMDRYMDHVDGYGSPPGGIVAPAAMPAAATITPTPSSPVSAIAAPVTSSTAPNSDRRPPSMAAIREDNPQTYQPTLPQPPQPPPTRQPTGVPLPVLQIPSPRDDERTPLASRQGTPMRSRSGSVSPVSPVSPMTPEDERPASLRGHS